MPAAGTRRKALPGSIEHRLEGRLDAEIAKARRGRIPVTAVAGEISTRGEGSPTRSSIQSTLTLAAGRATHPLVALDISPGGPGSASRSPACQGT